MINLYSAVSADSRAFYKEAAKQGYTKSELRRDFKNSKALGDRKRIYVGNRFCFIQADTFIIVKLSDIVWAYSQSEADNLSITYFDNVYKSEIAAVLVTKDRQFYHIACRSEKNVNRIIKRFAECPNTFIGANEEIADIYKNDFGRFVHIGENCGKSADVSL
jgi:hypothetical protein